MKILSRTTSSSIEEWFESVHAEGAAVLIDKEISWTSFDVVARLRGLIKVSKVGHAGTLDPLATGLLIICAGKATKQISSFQDMTKEYVTELKLGATTQTFDSEAVEENLHDVSSITEQALREVIAGFIGTIEQLPPMFSARKVGGKRLYQLARKGKTVERSVQAVEISELEILSLHMPIVQLRVRCSKGTYIRTLAHDIGQRLGCGAYMYSLRRTKIGEYNVDDALSVSDIQQLATGHYAEKKISEEDQ